MLVRTPGGSWHQHSIPAQRRTLRLSLFNRFFIFDIAASRLRRGSTSLRYFKHLKPEGQSIADQFDLITALDTATRRRSLTIDLHVSTGHGRR